MTTSLFSPETLDASLRLGSAVAIGGLVGLDRGLRQKPAGLRTHALVALGAPTRASSSPRASRVPSRGCCRASSLAWVFSAAASSCATPRISGCVASRPPPPSGSSLGSAWRAEPAIGAPVCSRRALRCSSSWPAGGWSRCWRPASTASMPMRRRPTWRLALGRWLRAGGRRGARGPHEPPTVRSRTASRRAVTHRRRSAGSSSPSRLLSIAPRRRAGWRSHFGSAPSDPALRRSAREEHGVLVGQLRA
jgi:hypothetical protein